MRVRNGVWGSVLLSALAFSAQAAEGGQITFRGAIVTGTCTHLNVGAAQCGNDPLHPSATVPAQVSAVELSRAGDPELLAYALNRQAGVTTRLTTVTYP